MPEIDTMNNQAAHRSSSILQDFDVKSFDISRAGSQLFPRAMTVSRRSGSGVFALSVDGDQANPLNPVKSGSTFSPVGQVFESSRSLISGAYILASNGVYWNSLKPDDDAKYTDWKKVQTPSGASEPFADWIAEFNDGNSVAKLYTLRTSSSAVKAYVNEQRLGDELVKNQADPGNDVAEVFYDLDNSSNSLFLTGKNVVLNSDRSVCSDASSGDEFSFAEVNDIVKIDGSFYALLNTTNPEAAVYTTTVSPKTGPWTLTTDYNPIVGLSSAYYLGAVDFLTRVPQPIAFNAARRDEEWDRIQGFPVIWNSPGCEPESVVSCLSDVHGGIKSFELNGVGSYSAYATLAPNDDEGSSVATYDNLISGGDECAVKWLVQADGTLSSSLFDLYGSIGSYAVGNVYNSNTGHTSAVVLDIPAGVSRTPEICEIDDTGLYQKVFFFNGSKVHPLSNDVRLNGPVTEFSTTVDKVIEEGQDDAASVEVSFCVAPMFSAGANRLGVHVFIANSGNYYNLLANPNAVISFSELSPLPSGIQLKDLSVQDVLLCNSSILYAKVVHSVADSSESGETVDYVKVFEADISELLHDFVNPTSGAALSPRTMTYIDFEPASDEIMFSMRNLIKGPSSENTIVDFSFNQIQTIALRQNGAWTLPFVSNPTIDTLPAHLNTMLDYALHYGASDLSAFAKKTFDSSFYSTAPYDELLGSTQLGSSNVKGVNESGTAVWRCTFTGSGSSTDVTGNVVINGKNDLVVSFEPATYTAMSNSSTSQPSSFPFSASSFGIASVESPNGVRKTGILVNSISKAVSRDGYFYATVYDVTGVRYAENPTYLSASGKWEWTAEPVTSEQCRYALMKVSAGSIVEVAAGTVASHEDDGSGELIGPESWNALGSSDKRPVTLSFQDWSLTRPVVFNEDEWTSFGEDVSIINGSGKYVSFNDKKVLTWNSSNALFMLDFSGASPAIASTFTDTSKIDGNIVALQNINDTTIYVFSIDGTNPDQTCTIKVYSGTYASFSASWNPVLIATVEDVDFLQTGSICLTTYITDDGSDAYKLFYSALNGGIKSIIAKAKYAIMHETLAEADGLQVDGRILKQSENGLLATGSGKLYSLARQDVNVDGQWITTFSRSEISSGLGDSLHDAYLNYSTRLVSSYTLTDSSFRPSIIELSANGARAVVPTSYNVPTVYDISSASNANSYNGVSFIDTGAIYQLSNGTHTPMSMTPLEVYNGKNLLSNMSYGFPTKEDIKEDPTTSAFRGTLMDMHIPSFSIDVSSGEKAVFIDNLYSTAELSDDFGQTYWLAIAQLDNRTSSLSRDDEIEWTHYYQRYKLNELYDMPFRFTDVLDFGTTSAQTVLTTQDGQVVYKAVPRADWDVSHLRKIVREQAHLDNACEKLHLHPDRVNVVRDIQTSPNTAVLLLQSGHDIILHANWRHDIKYFGMCVQPYSMFNSRIQDSSVTVISKYGDEDMDFVLGTSQGFIHFINGHLFAKAMYTDEDENTTVLSGNCTYAGCHVIDNGTSTENRFIFADGSSLYNLAEHNFDAKREIGQLFKLTGEIINDVFRIGDGAYAICTNKGIYTSRPKVIVKDYLDDYMLSDLNNDVDMAFSRLLAEHVSERHFTGSDMDVINHKIDRNFNPYPAGFTRASPVVTSRHVLDVDNDLVESIEVRLTDDQAAANTSNIFAAVKNEVLNNATTVTRTYAPPGWFDHVIDINDKNHVVDYSDVRYICRRWRSGVVEFYIYIPTTFTYYFNNLAGYSQSPYAGMSLVRPNAGNLQVANDVNSLRTDLRLFISNTTYKLNTIYMAQIVGNSLPLKIYKESTYCDANRAGLFDTIVQPSVVRALPAMTGRSKNNVNVLMNASEQICLDFSIYGSDAQAIHIMGR